MRVAGPLFPPPVAGAQKSSNLKNGDVVHSRKDREGEDETKMTKARRTALRLTIGGIVGLFILGSIVVQHFALGAPLQDKYGNSFTGWDAFWHVSLLGVFAGACTLRGMVLLIRNKL